jgi:hypothetical protein
VTRADRVKQPVVIGVALGLIAGILAAVVIVQVSQAGTQAAESLATARVAATDVVTGDAYPGDPTGEAALVTRESERLVYSRTVAASARWNEAASAGPYRLRTGTTFTLVLPARAEPYTVADLLQLAPDTFVAQADGSYLLKENILVLTGATLSFASEANATRMLTIRMESDETSFVSIVTMGGSLQVTGTLRAPVTLVSWNSTLGGIDTTTDDGRAYVRVIGGDAAVSYAFVSALGFWSGSTGGFALTGSDATASFDANSADGTTVAGAPVLAPEAVDTAVAEQYSSSSGSFDNVTFTGNAYGFFATSASEVSMTDSLVTGSLVDGLVLHRAVTDATITRTTSEDNAIDGFRVARSATGVTFDSVVSRDNGRNGLTLDGQSLAKGPSAAGTPVESYGDNTVTGSTFERNARYGVQVSGGRRVSIASSTISSNASGIVVDHAADLVAITDNSFQGQSRQGVAVRDGVLETTVSGNRISGGDTGIYARNADVDITGNTIGQVSNHGVTLAGVANGVVVKHNSIAGYGSVPVYSDGATGGSVGKNDVLDWHPAPTFASVVASVFQPLTIVWIALGIIVLATALTSAGARRGVIRHPYADRVPLSSFTKGIVSRDALREVHR